MLPTTSPAIHHLLFSPELNGRPFDCFGCPFATREPQEPTTNVPNLYVTCGLHGGKALGDAPTCTDLQWHARALKELGELTRG